MKGGSIFALSSGGGRGGVAVIRVSGPDAASALRRLCGRELPAPRRLVRVRIAGEREEGSPPEMIDEGLAVWFPAPASFTGEDVVEFHVHGGRAVAAGVLEVLGRCPGLRLAEPGEFTRRAFEHGKLDLTAAEAVADLVDAETAVQRRQAVRQLGGALAEIYEGWRQRLLRSLAHIEAALDFADEELPEALQQDVRSEIQTLQSEVAAHLNDGRRGERLRDGVQIAIIGPPNVGKSSLLNLLARRDAAIVSAVAGTTRDVIEVHLDLGGYPVVVADTAGLRESEDVVEREGVRRARARAQDADLRLAVLDATSWPLADKQTLELVDENTIVVLNKIDLKRPEGPLKVNGREARPIAVSTGSGIESLMDAVKMEVARCCDSAGGAVLTRARHREALTECAKALAGALAAEAIELMAEDLRLASRALGRITGRVDVEEVLDVIFRDFCIGK